MMMGNHIFFLVLTVCSQLFENSVFGYPELRVQGEEHPGCPDQDTGMATLLPHESDCGAYYMCQSKVAIVKTCPHDLHFNPKKKVCDFPDRAGCTTAEEDVLMSNGFPHPDCPSKDPAEPVILPHESDCSRFYICLRGNAYEKTCMPELHFNPRLRVCDFPENAKCANRIPEKRTGEQLKCPRINNSVATLLAHETDCTLYYICESGVPILRHCPDELHFNAKKSVCDFPERAGCQHSLPEKKTGLQQKCPRINKSVATLLAHETDCSLYYICESGVPILRYCPDDLHFNPNKLVCDFPARAGCRQDVTHVLLTGPEATGSPSPFCPQINGKYPVFVPHPTDCSVYYMCGNGLAYKFTCPSGLHFNRRLKSCDFPYEARCAKKGLHLS